MSEPVPTAGLQAARSWPALEAGGDVLTGFIHAVGVSPSFAFHDVYGLDEELLAMVPQPAHALVLLFPDPKRSGQTRDAISSGSSPFFLWQSPALGNACGTIAAIHAVANSVVVEQLAPGPLADYLAKARALHPEDRGVVLEADEAIRRVHAAQAEEGQTGMTDEVDSHFVCFVHSQGRLYELDGLKGAPVDHGPTDQGSLLSNAARVIKSVFMDRQGGSINFALLALGPSTD